MKNFENSFMESWLHNFAIRHPSFCRLLGGGAVVALLCIYAAEVTAASRDLSATWDEPYHLLAGYRYWQAGDYGINPEHPPLAKLIGAFPLLFMHLKVPRIGRDDSKPTAIVAGRALVFENDADVLMLRARLAEALVGLLFLLLLFEAGYRMFGAGVASIAVFLAVFDPNLLAHCPLVTTDFALTCFFFGAVYALWRVAEHPAFLPLVGCGVMSGLALASKHSGLLLLPTLGLLAGVEVAVRVKSAARGGSALSRVFWRETQAWTGRLAVIYALAGVILWGFYGFRYAARPDGLPLWQSIPSYAALLRGPLAPWLVDTAARVKLLPQSYLFGLVDVLWVTAGPRVSFLLGHLSLHALWYYFPVAFVIKSTLGFLGLLILAIAAIKAWSGECYRKAAYLLIPPTFFMAVALTSGTNMGIRHVLPVYPFLILAAAAGAWEVARRRPAWAIVVAVLLAFHLASSVHALPNYLAYSNELFGGTSRTYLALSDSNSDWGQGLRQAREYLERRNVRDCWLAYFGSADPAYYHLPCKLLPDPFLPWWREPAQIPPENYHGVVLVSGTEIAAPYWEGDDLNPYSRFLHLKPAANIGGSILVYEGDVDLRRPSAVAHVYKAWELIGARDWEGAIQEALKAEDLAPDHPAPPLIIGAILARAKRTEAARIQYETCLKLAQAHPVEMASWAAAAKAQLARLPAVTSSQ